MTQENQPENGPGADVAGLQTTINTLHERLGAAYRRIDDLENYFTAMAVKQEERLLVLERFLPALQETFAGRVGGSSADANEAMAALENAPADAVKDAIESVDPQAAATAAGEAGPVKDQ